VKRTVVPAGAGDERSAERFREPTLLAPGRRRHQILSQFFVCAGRFEREKKFSCALCFLGFRVYIETLNFQLFSLFHKLEIEHRRRRSGR